ncbi:heme ABC transporter ATP-binding protein [Dyella caseinilytica]|uniref:heme ABC transporter ATP-binding protein n=1 Tax=Dyella caseinilytica TaxID=1849581 RepID=UPI001940003D|nr:heme ABC transporter ATP-binding protein [Dyella caseinilytica]GFZ88096.1 hemin import ATP-binding protein HmuV [Dyella caseinilytica]
MNTPLDWRSPSANSGVLAARDIHLTRQGRAVLQGINLQAHPGRVLALIGPNGAGKSSLLGALAGWMAPSLGEVSLDGKPLSAWPTMSLARRRAMLSQNVQLGFAFLVEEVVMLGRTPGGRHATHAQDAVIVEQALRLAQVAHLRGRNYLELSGGEQQRVQLARVLAQVWEQQDGPAWLLLDEPEAGLDIAHQHDMLKQMRALSRRGYGVIVVLHDLNLAARYADEIALLTQGRLVRLGTPDYALDAQALSKVYGLVLDRVPVNQGQWIVMPR